MTKRATLLGLVALTATAVAAGVGALDQEPAGDRRGALRPATTEHVRVPGEPSRFWLLPDASFSAGAGARSVPLEPDTAAFAQGARLIASEDFAAGLELVAEADLSSTPLAAYPRYYAGLALLGLDRAAEAEAVFATLADDALAGRLLHTVPLRRAEAALAQDDPARAADILGEIEDDAPGDLAGVLVRLGAAHEAAGGAEAALDAYRRVYYEFPLSGEASEAREAIARLAPAPGIPSELYALELARAERLFGAGRWAEARAGFETLARGARGDNRELIALRLAECDYHLGRHRAAQAGLRPFLQDSPHEPEARFFHLSAARALGDDVTYVKLARALVADYPRSTWAEEALNNLASHYIIEDEDEAADLVFRELARLFPAGRHADRAAWKIGWQSYKDGEFADAARRFEEAAAAFPRADYRPSWLYWAARARDRSGDRAAANVLYHITASDYLNSYYGRLASRVLAEREQPPVTPIVQAGTAREDDALHVPTEPLIRALVSLGLHDDALAEVEYGRREWGDSAVLQATAAGIRHRRGFEGSSPDRFLDVRGGITLMRRAYPQFMAAGGEHLPPEILRVIFPIDYWPLIRKYSEAHGLDPYLMTALVAQESTFTADVRSAANAVGLMQLIPGTGRRYAARLGLRPFSERLLTTPETNVRLGMRYFKDLMDRFGGEHFALASYNAGERRVAEWIAERPGFSRDEFIDDIPFPETQNYVKRILGTAEDYRRLYGGGILPHTPGT